jgi:hypothetical protein
MPLAMKMAGVTTKDIHFQEINEAFAAVVLANIKVPSCVCALAWGGRPVTFPDSCCVCVFACATAWLLSCLPAPPPHTLPALSCTCLPPTPMLPSENLSRGVCVCVRACVCVCVRACVLAVHHVRLRCAARGLCRSWELTLPR